MIGHMCVPSNHVRSIGLHPVEVCFPPDGTLSQGSGWQPGRDRMGAGALRRATEPMTTAAVRQCWMVGKGLDQRNKAAAVGPRA